MTPDLGTDLSLMDGFAPHFPSVAGPKNLIEALYRRITTDPESQAGQAIYQGRCMDVRRLLAKAIDGATVAGAELAVCRTCQEDERVSAARARMTFQPALRKLRLELSVTPEDGSEPFRLVLAVTQVTVEVLDG